MVVYLYLLYFIILQVQLSYCEKLTFGVLTMVVDVAGTNQCHYISCTLVVVVWVITIVNSGCRACVKERIGQKC